MQNRAILLQCDRPLREADASVFERGRGLELVFIMMASDFAFSDVTTFFFLIF